MNKYKLLREVSAKNNWHSRQRAARNQLALTYFGSGFVTTASGRVFLPLIGRPKLVPSPAAEVWLATSWPRWWHVLILVGLCMMAAGARVNGASLSPLASTAIFIGAPVLAIVFWCWRERSLTITWGSVPDLTISRTALVVDALGGGSLFQIFGILAGLIFFAAWQVHIFGEGAKLPSLPFSGDFTASDLRRWAALLLLIVFYGFIARTMYWLLLALIRRMRRSAA